MKKSEEPTPRIEITKDGPYLVKGGLPLSEQLIVTNAEGESLDYAEGKKYPAQPQYALCRCGRSGHKPFCDGTHATVHFDGTETASREPYLKQAETIDGPTMVLTDAESLCAFARFCHRAGGTWKLTQRSDDPEAKKIAVEEAGACPSGRLTVWNKKTGQPIEPEFDPSLSVIEDPGAGVSGPIRLKGGVPIVSADGTEYEIRNRATLCRCGRSANKPFCDGSHIEAGFNDGDGSIKK